MKETETIEFKKSTSEMKETIISMVSILNKHHKGKIIFGVKDNGKVVGQDISEKTLREISQKISNSIEPKIYPKIYERIIDDKKCVVVEFKGNNKPYYAYGRVYMRVADEDRSMSAKEVEKLILEKNKNILRWDKEFCEKAVIEDIDEEKVKVFLEKSSRSYDSIENSLQKLGLIEDKNISNACVALFGSKPQDIFPNMRLRCAVFGTEDTTLAIDMQDFYGDLFYLIEEAQKYILKNIHIGMKIEGLERIDVSEINKDAFREAIINAFCHRDYYLYDSVNIAIFKDRVEIRSPGLLFGGLTLDEIKIGGVSERRNEIIAEMFYLVHFVEKWGQGIKKILYLEPETEFKEIGRQFITVFRRNVDKNVDRNVDRKLLQDERLCLIIEKISEGSFNIRNFALSIDVDSKTIERDLVKLKDRVKFIGSPKGGHWEVLFK